MNTLLIIFIFSSIGLALFELYVILKLLKAVEDKIIKNLGMYNKTVLWVSIYNVTFGLFLLSNLRNI